MGYVPSYWDYHESERIVPILTVRGVSPVDSYDFVIFDSDNTLIAEGKEATVQIPLINGLYHVYWRKVSTGKLAGDYVPFEINNGVPKEDKTKWGRTWLSFKVEDPDVSISQHEA